MARSSNARIWYMRRYILRRRSSLTFGIRDSSTVPSGERISRRLTSREATGLRAIGLLQMSLHEQLGGAVRGTHERAGGDVQKALLARELPEFIELFRGHKTVDHEMVARTGGPKILTQRQNVDADGPYIFKSLEQLRFGFAET